MKIMYKIKLKLITSKNNKVPYRDLPILCEVKAKSTKEEIIALLKEKLGYNFEFLEDNTLYGGHFATFDNPSVYGDSVILM